jgi:hypothetical protein
MRYAEYNDLDLTERIALLIEAKMPVWHYARIKHAEEKRDERSKKVS